MFALHCWRLQHTKKATQRNAHTHTPEVSGYPRFDSHFCTAPFSGLSRTHSHNFTRLSRRNCGRSLFDRFGRPAGAFYARITDFFPAATRIVHTDTEEVTPSLKVLESALLRECWKESEASGVVKFTYGEEQTNSKI